MNYLISKFDCVIFFDKKLKIEKNILYEFENYEKQEFLVVGNGEFVPFVFDMSKPCINVKSCQLNGDSYYYICPEKIVGTHIVSIKHKTNEILIEYSSKVFIDINGNRVFEKEIDNIQYSHYEEFGDFCLAFFDQNFVVVIRDNEVKFCSRYFECNKTEDEYYFLEKLFDSLNHGRVCHIKQKEIEEYLVYLDNEELNLKSAFVANVFLDCVLAGNFKYCNKLLAEELQQTNEKEIAIFFPEFDDYFPIKENEIMLIKKNAPQGIYKFEIANSLIQNITIQHL